MTKVKLLSVAAVLSLASVLPNAYALKNGEKFKSWTAQCEQADGKQFCGITQIVNDKQNKPVVNFFIRKVPGQPAPLMFVKVPLGVTLTEGLDLTIDKEKLGRAPFAYCDPAGCNVVAPLQKEVIAKMKKGSNLHVTFYALEKKFALKASLSGFTKAIESL